MQQVMLEYQGILPTPQMFQGYDDVVPGAANRILVLAEEESDHRRGMDRRFARYRTGALVAGTVIALAGLALCGYLVRRGATGWAVAAFLAEVVALVGPFLFYRRAPIGR